MTHEPVAVIGLGQDGPATLSAAALDHIRRARVLAGGKRHLDFFADSPAERIVIDADLDRVIARLQECYRRHKTVVLATGDPLYYGIGRRLLDGFTNDDLVFLPQVSSVQLAFARLKETWHDARVVSVHGRPMETLLPALAQREEKIAILTDAKNNPAAIARFLADRGCGTDYSMWVCEDLGGPHERIGRWMPGAETAALNVVILLRNAGAAPVRSIPLIGIPEQELRHRTSGGRTSGGTSRCSADGLITRREVRLLAICHLELSAGDVLWDVGAGSGSVGIEAARLSPQLQVWAVEKDPQALQDIKENVARFGLLNVQVVLGSAPHALQQLPDPDRVFIGGSGGLLIKILEVVARRLKPGGRLVLNCVALETFMRAWTWLHNISLNPEATSLQLAHSRPLGSLHCLEPEKPLFILRALKP
jgi:precorrin-6Y C5,15-methyltransferase (decarboxylating)